MTPEWIIISAGSAALLFAFFISLWGLSAREARRVIAAREAKIVALQARIDRQERGSTRP